MSARKRESAISSCQAVQVMTLMRWPTKEGVPIGMIFVPSAKGVSHQGDEYTKPEHIDMGADVLYQTVLKLDENGF